MSSNDRHDQLELLLHEAGQARDDDRYMFYQFPTLITVALALMVAMAALYSNTYPIGHRPPDLPNNSPLVGVPVWVYACAPLLPIVLISYSVLISTLGTLRSYYIRAIERRIHEITSSVDEQFPVPSWAHLQVGSDRTNSFAGAGTVQLAINLRNRLAHGSWISLLSAY